MSPASIDYTAPVPTKRHPMSILRVLLAVAPDAATATAWALYDDQQRLVRSGSGPAASWPAATRREAVLAASAVRLVPVVLPPMPADRLPAAAAFALEDRLAGPAPARHLAVSPRQRDGVVEVAIAARDVVAALARDFARVVAEPAVAPRPPAGTWRWYASGAGGGFVRSPDGAAFAVPLPVADAALPPELTLALAQASPAAGAPTRVEIAFPVAADARAAWTRATGVAFVTDAPWRWDQDAVALAGATDLRQGEFAAASGTTAIARSRGLRIPLAIAAAALCLHVAASVGQWATWRFESWQARRAIVATARAAGANDTEGADAAANALRERWTLARQRAGRSTPNAALPLLARAAPALAALPAGTLKSATYASGTWTLDLARIEPAVATRLESELTGAGLATLAAPSASGLRLRLAPAPGTELP